MKKRVHIFLTERQIEKLKVIIDEKQIDRSEFLRRVIDEVIEEFESKQAKNK